MFVCVYVCICVFTLKSGVGGASSGKRVPAKRMSVSRYPKQEQSLAGGKFSAAEEREIGERHGNR